MKRFFSPYSLKAGAAGRKNGRGNSIPSFSTQPPQPNRCISKTLSALSYSLPTHELLLCKTLFHSRRASMIRCLTLSETIFCMSCISK